VTTLSKLLSYTGQDGWIKSTLLPSIFYLNKLHIMFKIHMQSINVKNI